MEQVADWWVELFESAPAAIFVKDLAGRYQFANPMFEALASGKDLIGKTDLELFGPEIAQKMAEAERDVIATRTPRQLEQVFPSAEGTRAYLTTCFPLRAGGAKPVGLAGISVEITDRHRLEEERSALLDRLTRRTAQLKAVLENMVDPVVVVDHSHRIILLNRAVRRLTGLGETAMLSDLDRTLLGADAEHPPDVANLPIYRALAGEVIRELVIPVADQAGRQVSLRVNAGPIRNAEGQVTAVVAVARDITETVELEQLEEQFIRVAAHELKTPVAVIKSFAQLALAQGEAVPENLAKMLQAINRGTDRIETIVQSLLDLSQIQSRRLKLNLAPVELRALAEEVARRVASVSLPNEVRVVGDPRVKVEGDRERLAQILLTLLRNAVRFSPEGGPVELSVEAHADRAFVGVTDQGVGIPEAKQGHVFERFQRAHGGTPYDYGGMGVGLFIARELVSLHGGRMGFESREGHGSRFWFELPRLEEDEG